MAQGYNYFLSRVLEPVSPQAGGSGYFSDPTETLDPHLFDGDTFKPDVRTWILNTFHNYIDGKYSGASEWATVWIAGSGISYQWSAARGNGDLDILVGVYWPKFFRHNQKFVGLSEDDMAAIINQEMHADLWPKTAEQTINGQTYEVTFYINPGSTDIRDINPYAAYNLSHNNWTVRPPQGDDFNHPEAHYKQADAEVKFANDLVSRYNTQANQVKAMQPGSPGWHNSVRQAELLVSQASELYDSIHTGRRAAFSEGGEGYGDYHNFRWQYHKKHGTAQALNAVRKAHKDSREQFNSSLYGSPVDAHDVALRRAALWNRGGNGR